MLATEFYRERFGGAGGLGGPFELIIGCGLLLAMAIGLCHVLAGACRKPSIFLVLAGCIAFWPLAFRGHLWWALAAVAGGMVLFRLASRDEAAPAAMEAAPCRQARQDDTQAN